MVCFPSRGTGRNVWSGGMQVADASGEHNGENVLR